MTRISRWARTAVLVLLSVVVAFSANLLTDGAGRYSVIAIVILASSTILAAAATFFSGPSRYRDVDVNYYLARVAYQCRKADSGYVPTRFSGRDIDLKDSGEIGASHLLEISRKRRIFVTGAPGSGKTTLLSSISYRLCADYLSDRNSEVPLPLRARDWRAEYSLDFEGWMIDQLQSHYSLGSKRSIGKFLDRSQCVVLLDGLDEAESPSTLIPSFAMYIGKSSMSCVATSRDAFVTLHMAGVIDLESAFSTFIRFTILPPTSLELESRVQEKSSKTDPNRINVYRKLIEQSEGDERILRLLLSTFEDDREPIVSSARDVLVERALRRLQGATTDEIVAETGLETAEVQNSFEALLKEGRIERVRTRSGASYYSRRDYAPRAHHEGG